MAYTSFYSRINFINQSEGTTTPLDKINLNKMDSAIETLDLRTVDLDVRKAEQATVLDMVKSWAMDEKTGVITVTKLNGEQIMFDLNVEKIPVSFSMSEDGVLTMTTDDGTEYTADIGNMIPTLTFNSSDTINVIAEGEGINKTYSFEIKDGAVTEGKLQPNFLADIKVESAGAASSAEGARTNAIAAESYTHGGTGTREGEDTDNAKYYYERAKEASGTEIATTSTAGISRPDGSTIQISDAGVLSTTARVFRALEPTVEENVLSARVDVDEIKNGDILIITMPSSMSQDSSTDSYLLRILRYGTTALQNEYTICFNFFQGKLYDSKTAYNATYGQRFPLSSKQTYILRIDTVNGRAVVENYTGALSTKAVSTSYSSYVALSQLEGVKISARANSTPELMDSGSVNGDTVTLFLEQESTYMLFIRTITVSTGKIYGARAIVISVNSETEATANVTAGNAYTSTNAGYTQTLGVNEYSITTTAAYQTFYELYKM